MWTETTDSFLRITQFWKETFAVNDVWGDDTSRQSDEQQGAEQVQHLGGEEPSGKAESKHQDGREQQESQAVLIS